MPQIDVHKLSDHARFNGFHGTVLFWCALIIIFDGYDLAVAGIALPSIMKEMGVSPTNAGFMVSSALFGMMFGAIFMGTIADRIGRRWAIALCILLFSVFTVYTAAVNTGLACAWKSKPTCATWNAWPGISRRPSRNATARTSPASYACSTCVCVTS